MKKYAFIAAVAMAVIASACSGESSDKKVVRTANDSTSLCAQCNIRYIDVDSVLAAYTLAQELVAEQQKEMVAVESQARQKESELQRFQSSIENKYRSNGYLSEESLKADMNSLQQRQDEAGRWLNTHQERLARLVASQQQRLSDSLQNFLKAYNEVYNYDAILDKKAGFFKPELDITGEIIEGLNARYTPEK